MIACKNVFDDTTLMVQLLIDAGADVNIQNNDGNTALMIAYGKYEKDCFIDTVKLLLDYGADIYIRNNQRDRVIDFHYDHLPFLLSYYNKVELENLLVNSKYRHRIAAFDALKKLDKIENENKKLCKST